MDQATRYSDDDLSLDDVIRRVAGCAVDMHAFPKALSREPAKNRLKELRAAVTRIGHKVSRKPPPLERYLLQWRQFAAGEATTLDRGTVRYLCWESNVATSPLFLAYLYYSGSRLSRRSIEGLVQSCHHKWEGDFPESQSVASVRTFVEGYQGTNPVLRRWKANLDAVLGPDGPSLLGRDLALKGERLSSYLNQWYLAPQSPFVGMLVKEAAAECRKRLGSGSSATQTLLFTDLLPWPCWKMRDLKEELGHLILHGAMTGQIRDDLLTFVSRHKQLGDPRIDENRRNWGEMSLRAKNRLVEWFNDHSELEFFDRVYRYGQGWVVQARRGTEQTLAPDWSRKVPG
ncbi:MAG TPA: hypothetical protein DCR97_14070 [Deltaproteobacteria bacterium]|nr:hypothetical protein [Deltaproteobacteria bacterium]